MTNSLLLMSILNDINVQDGYGIRVLASGIPCSQGFKFLEVVSGINCHRMDSETLSLEPTADRQNAAEIANAHWVDEDGNYCWGTPSGSWRDYCMRVRKDPQFARQGRYMPTTKVEVDEQHARDLLLATYMFPFTVRDTDANIIASDIILPTLAAANPKKVHVGSRGVYRLLRNCMNGGEITNFTTVKSRAANFRELSEFNILWSISAGPNFFDSSSAIRRASNIDWDAAEKGHKYVCLAEFANYIESCMARGAAKGPAMRAAKKWKNTNAEIDLYGMSEHMKKSGNTIFAEGKSKAICTTAIAPKMRTAATSAVALVRLDGEFYLLTREDLKSLKFVAMSHSLWHMYAATISVEYVPNEEVRHPGLTDSDINLAKAAAEAVAKAMKILSDIASKLPTVMGQKVVEYPTLRSSIDSVWDWYERVIHDAIDSNVQDYVGRYINEVFSVYTAVQGGSLMANAVGDAIAEVVEEYGELGFEAARDIRDLIAIFNAMPESAIQDFGRLAKIVPAYDVNPIYSFLNRAKKMQEPNPRGRARMTGDFSHEVTEYTESECDASDILLECAANICVVLTDVKARALDAMTDEDRENMENTSFEAVYSRMRARGRAVASAATLTGRPLYPIPAGDRAEARLQARRLLEESVDPSNVYAGAYINVANVFPYAERGDPDLAILKATAIVSGDLTVAMSNLSGIRRATPTRLSDGMKQPGTGTMITDFLLGKFPSRSEALAFVGTFMPIASTSDKIETVKYPLKTRVITSMCAEGRRIQGEYEFNNGKVLVHAPGFMVGVSPADRLRRTYAALRQDLPPDIVRLYGSLDLSSFSQGMHWRVQAAINRVLAKAYGMSRDLLSKLEACTLGTYMIRAESNLRLFTVNDVGSNYEGLDGKRNTFMHCALWYIARCKAYSKGIGGTMRAFIYIDDGAFSLDVQKDAVDSTARIVREALIETYTAFGFKLNLSKTVISSSYMQFLNEIFLHGVHIGYGFRALCHTGAQTFPTAATVSEELAVITGGIRGAGVAGGHSLRLVIGMNYIIWLYLSGVIGSKGRYLNGASPFATSVLLYLPKAAGGMGIPPWVQLFSNLTGHRDTEHLAKVALMGRACANMYPEKVNALKSYAKHYMIRSRWDGGDTVPTRLSVNYAPSTLFGPGDRDLQIANAAMDMCANEEFRPLIRKYVDNKGTPSPSGVAKALSIAMTSCPTKLPPAIIEKALSTDPAIAVSTLITKVTSGFLINRMLKREQIRALDRRYVANAKEIVCVARLYLD